MRPPLARWLIRLYPRRWRERYGDEFQALLESSPGNTAALADIVRSALRERLIPSYGGRMNPDPGSFARLIRRPSAFLPMAMSLTALSVVLVHIATYGVVHEADEGAAAHIWQILMAGQIPLLAWFAFQGLRKAPRPALGVLALQAVAALASVAPVFLLHM